MASNAPDSCTPQPRQAPESPVVVDPAKPPSVEVVLVGHAGKALMPMLVLPGVRVCVDGLSTDIDASEWWKDVAVAALYASLCYQSGGIEFLR